MSTIAYGALTRKRIEAEPRKSLNEQPPGVRTYIDTFAALVPAEVLALHALIISFATETVNGQTRITHGATVSVVFWVLTGLSILLYFFGRLGGKEKLQVWDALRAPIPPLAFVGWTMLQKVTAFDAVAPGVPSVSRIAMAAIGAVVLGAASSLLANVADRSVP